MAKDPLELAAASPDPAVRALAVRRHEINEELARLDAFFRVYEDIGRDLSTVAPVTAPRTPKLALVEPSATKAQTEFVPAVHATLRRAGAPMQFGALYDAFFAENPSYRAMPKNSFRQRLLRARAEVTYGVGPFKGYWIAGEPEPDYAAEAADVDIVDQAAS